MSENRFSDCETPQAVLRSFRQLEDVDADDHDDALARIAELTPPKDENLRDHAEHILRVHGLLNPTPRPVDEAGRERAREVTYDWWLNTTGMSRANADQLVDRIIDALGWTAAEPERDCENCGGRKCMSCCSREMHDDCADDCPMCCPAPVPPAPVVELDADDLSALSDCLREWADLVFNIGVDEDHEIPTGVGRIAYSEATGKWVLRIGGDQ